MNELLELRGGMRPMKMPVPSGGISFSRDFVCTSDKIRRLITRLSEVQSYWSEGRGLEKTLINVHYQRVIPKTGRITVLLREKGCLPSQSIRGARFETATDEQGSPYHRHVFTHYVSLPTLESTRLLLERLCDVVDRHFNGRLAAADIDAVEDWTSVLRNTGFSPSSFKSALKDAGVVEDFDVPMDDGEYDEDTVVSLYDLGVEPRQMLLRFGIDVEKSRVFNSTTVRLTVGEIQKLRREAPYLISMGFVDLNSISPVELSIAENRGESVDVLQFSHPDGEPIVGVIDTQFDTSVHFAEWVQFENRLDPNIPIGPEDAEHGTGVSFIIVDGPSLNPRYDDGCGRFRVRHFGVATQHGFRSSEIMRQIREIVCANRDIKVWNLSLGTDYETQENFISPQAAELDALQYEYDDIVFVVAGTNRRKDDPVAGKRMGAPADSLNSIVVNAVDQVGCPASYTRVGPVLSFFRKPDVACFGGDGELSSQQVCVYNGGIFPMTVKGTSYAAPWMARKMAYMMQVLGLTREVAKALLLDSAIGWDLPVDTARKGYGVVPTRIEDVLGAADSEIRFVISGRMEEYEMCTYNLPVPMREGKFPYYARATLAYMPYCDRNLGVDYTGTEMDLRLGRVKKDKDGRYRVSDIKNNRQGEERCVSNIEERARQDLRKWDNIKHIVESVPEHKKPREHFGSDFWGLRVITKDRMSQGKKTNLPYGVVVTLKEMNGENRIEDFERACLASGWLVNRVDVLVRAEVNQQGRGEVPLE